MVRAYVWVRLTPSRSRHSVIVQLVTPLSSSISVQSRSSSDERFTVEVPVGATADCSQNVVAVGWEICSNATLATGYPHVNVQAPTATTVTLTIAQSRLTDPTDPAAVAPISIPTSSAVSVSVAFDDGTTRDFTNDARTVVTVDAAYSACATYTTGTLTILAGATYPNATCSQVVLTAVVLRERDVMPIDE